MSSAPPRTTGASSRRPDSRSRTTGWAEAARTRAGARRRGETDGHRSRIGRPPAIFGGPYLTAGHGFGQDTGPRASTPGRGPRSNGDEEGRMNRWFRQAAAVLLIQALARPAGAFAAGPPRASADEDARIVHVLNRLGYGPRPGDIEKVRAVGLEKWMALQLHPERIDDRALQARLAGYRTLGLSAADLLSGYEVPREVKREIQKKRAEMGEDASEEDRAKARREFMRQNAGNLSQMQGRPRQVVEELQAAKVTRAVFSERQLDEVMVDFWLNHFNVFAG